jgi:hypothetical protein
VRERKICETSRQPAASDRRDRVHGRCSTTDPTEAGPVSNDQRRLRSRHSAGRDRWSRPGCDGAKSSGRSGADPLRARGGCAEPERGQQVLSRTADGRGLERGQARLCHLRQPRVRLSPRHPAGADQRIEVQVGLQQLQPGQRGTAPEGLAVGHPARLGSQGGNLRPYPPGLISVVRPLLQSGYGRTSRHSDIE